MRKDNYLIFVYNKHVNSFSSYAMSERINNNYAISDLFAETEIHEGAEGRNNNERDEIGRFSEDENNDLEFGRIHTSHLTQHGMEWSH